MKGFRLILDELPSLGNLSSFIQLDHPSHCSQNRYLDPMYPSKRKIKSLSKKDMIMLRYVLNKESLNVDRKLVGTDSDTIGLLQIAKTVAKASVVLKRPYYVAPDPNVTSYRSRTTHYDIYKKKSDAVPMSTQVEENAPHKELQS